MAVDKAKAEAREERIQKLKAEGKWRPEPTYDHKHYMYKDEFYLDKDGNKLVLENEDDDFISETSEEPDYETETNNSCKTKIKHAKKSIRKVNGKKYSESVITKAAPLTEEDYNHMTNEILTTLKSNEIINST